ncbi:WbqC family protein [Mycobacterium sp. ML4]
MQPYFLPYIGYFQLLEYCDTFVVYDDIKYTKKGWINRNRILTSGSPRTITLPLRRASDFADVRDREIAPEYSASGMLALLRQSYHKAPLWAKYEQFLREVLEFPSRNLFDFVANSISAVARCLGIETELVVSSSLGIDRSFRGEERVLATCAAVGATEYVNPIGGLDLYHDSAFTEHGIRLSFLRSLLTPYAQFSSPYVEALSIVDTMMFVEPHELRNRVQSDYEILVK